MTPRWRSALLGLAGICLAPAVWRVAAALPAFGKPTEQYGPAVNRLGPPLRHVSNMVSAVNFDIRGIDTLGEEFMLLCAVTGAVVLLRGARGEDLSAKAGRLEGRAVIGRAEFDDPDLPSAGPSGSVVRALYGAARDGHSRRRLSGRCDHRLGSVVDLSRRGLSRLARTRRFARHGCLRGRRGIAVRTGRSGADGNRRRLYAERTAVGHLPRCLFRRINGRRQCRGRLCCDRRLRHAVPRIPRGNSGAESEDAV